MAAGIVTWSSIENVQTIAAIVGIFVLLPLAIMTYRDAVRRVAMAAPNKSMQASILGLPVRFLGLVSLTMGLAIIAWVGYNLLVSRQEAFTGTTSFAQLVPPIVLAVLGWRWLRRPLAKDREDEAA